MKFGISRSGQNTVPYLCTMSAIGTTQHSKHTHYNTQQSVLYKIQMYTCLMIMFGKFKHAIKNAHDYDLLHTNIPLLSYNHIFGKVKKKKKGRK